ncbi:MAG: undecaprenyl/decaprenyl-phosphate alpha-N-acetylglucosaminyl 1-phosphate transferase [Alphaproteobacteria bacterium]|nr:undecaprenyl/decaprenyl-phosphate alpha-N-acetylglucosaminyl 1-phosphate transferase [Alphaproteobacteria bacterium]
MSAIVLGLLALAFIICLCARPLAARLGVVDVPDGRRKVHARATPLVGGIAVLVPVVVMAVVQAARTDLAPLYLTLALGAAAFMVLGFVDDRRSIRPLYRLVAAIVFCAVALLAVPALRIEFLLFTVAPKLIVLAGWPAWLFTLACLVGLQNSVNMADGEDGLAGGLALLWSALLLAYAPAHLAPVLVTLIGALAIVLGFNLRGRLFLGDAGSYGISILIGLLTVYVYAVGFDGLRADVIVLWFCVPVLDCLRLMATRIAAGRSPFSSDRSHLHHVLKRWLPWRYGLAVYLGLVGLPAVLAVWRPGYTLLWLVIELSLYAAILVRGARRPVSALGAPGAQPLI